MGGKMLKVLCWGGRPPQKPPGLALSGGFGGGGGLGAGGGVFTLTGGVWRPPPPYQNPERLVLIPSARSDGQPQGRPQAWAAKQWMEWQKEAKSFQGIAAYSWSFNFLVLREGSVSLQGMWVTHDYFRVAGLQPMLGRTFLESETGAKPALPFIILVYNLWQRQFNGDRNIIGNTIPISRWDPPPTVLCVMAPGVR